MRRKTKQLLSLITTAAMSASSISALAANVTFDVTPADEARTAVVIEATYDGDLLEKAEIIDTVTIGANAKDYTVNDAVDGAKYFLWDSADGMKPLAPSKTAEGETPTGPVETEKPTDPVDDVTVIKSWKFDMGTAEDVSEGWTAVTNDVNYTLNTSGEDQYGFIGANAKDYTLAGGRIDGFVQQEGQTIELTAGGGTGLNDGIGSIGQDISGNAGDKYYPVRFALKVPDDTYYRIKATVTTLDNSKDATASLYTERKHPLYTNKTIKAGETVTTEFTIRPTAIYYQKSDPRGAIEDGMVNVAVLGENTALAALEIDQIETAPVLWVLGDSTVTDGGATLPYSPYPNYTGVGTGLTKYLPHNIAMVNEGEGGLSATDNDHFNMVKDRIKAGDFMYVEYGHNHKNDRDQNFTNLYWQNNYLQSLKKYYEACRDKDATLIIVGPIDRHKASQYDSETNTWRSTLNDFSAHGKQYVDCLKYGGEDVAEAFLKKWAEISTVAETAKNSGADVTAATAELVAAADRICADAIAGGETKLDNVAFVDLNKPSLDWYTTLTAGATVAGAEVKNDIRLTDYYFQLPQGGNNKSVDGTHPNDAGAENLAYFFYSTADTEEYPALKPLMTEYTKEAPTPVGQDVLDLGWAANDAWPYYYKPSYDYPIVIKDVNYEEKTLTAYVQDSFSNYASGVIDVYNANGELDKKYVTVNHVDNTTGNGTNILTLPDGIEIGENQTTKIYMWSCYLDREELIPEDEGGERLSAYYVPSEVDAYLVPGQNGDVEDFDYYGKTTLTEAGWTTGGSSDMDVTLGEDNGVTYANLKAVSKGGASWYVMKPFSNIEGGTGVTGKYLIDFNLKYNSGYGFNVNFAKTIKSQSPFASDEVNLISLNSSSGGLAVNGQNVGTLNQGFWTNVHYILDMDHGNAVVSVDGGDPVTVAIPLYAKFTAPEIDTMNNLVFNGTKSTFDVQISNLTVAKLKDEATTTTITVESEDTNKGTVEGTATVKTATAATVKATPADGYRFIGWYEGETFFSDEADLTVDRLYRDLKLTAKFVLSTKPAKVTVNYVDGDGRTIKDPSTITEWDGNTLYSGDPFTLSGDSYTAAYKETNDNGLYDVYLYDSDKSDALTIESLDETNTIDIVYKKLDGEYFEYEDFADTATGEWGFTEGKSGNVATENGALSLLKNAGTSATGSDVKTLSEDVQAAKKVTVSFDWKNNVESGKGRNSLFNLYDSEGAYIFSMNGHGSNGVDYAVGAAAGSGTNVGNVAATYRVVLTIDFESGSLTGTVTNLSTNAVSTINATSITAKNLAAIHADYGYSAASQRLDNFGIRKDAE